MVFRNSWWFQWRSTGAWLHRAVACTTWSLPNCTTLMTKLCRVSGVYASVWSVAAQKWITPHESLEHFRCSFRKSATFEIPSMHLWWPQLLPSKLHLSSLCGIDTETTDKGWTITLIELWFSSDLPNQFQLCSSSLNCHYALIHTEWLTNEQL